MDSSFRFKRFSVHNESSALKVGTDAVLLGAAMTICKEDKFALDIGTGTGVIALMAAQRSDTLMIDAIDIDGPSAEEAALNFRESPWNDRLHAIECDLADFRPTHEFDLIFSNPPYYDDSLRNPDERISAARHNCSLNTAQIFSFAQEWLSETGRISMILPADRLISSRRLASSFDFRPFRTIFVKTVEKKVPKRVILELSRRASIDNQETIVLMEGGDRSRQYKELTRDFYLDSSH